VIGSGDLAEPNSAFGVESAEHMINNQLLTDFNVVRAADDARALADWHNRLQRLAASTRLGIPITLSTDPRNHFTENVGWYRCAGWHILPMAGNTGLAGDRFLCAGGKLCRHRSAGVPGGGPSPGAASSD
jgi:hypothetical protein